MASDSRDEGIYDYIIIGAGSAGCVLAYRLSEDPKLRILVLEAGGDDRAVIVDMPSALTIPMNTKRFNWGMETEPEPGLDGRRVNLPRGRGLGAPVHPVGPTASGWRTAAGHHLPFPAG